MIVTNLDNPIVLQRADGVWYIHFAAGDVEKRFSIRMYALSNPSEDPASVSDRYSSVQPIPIDS